MPKTKIHLVGNITDFDIRLLRVFRAVVAAEGFAAAAVELNVTRSVISTSIADLEQRVGLRLCHRGRAGFALTEAGASVHEQTLQLFAQLEAFQGSIAELHSSPRGRLRLGITDNLICIPEMNIVNSLRVFRTAAPQVQIDITTLPANEIEKAILNGGIDVGVIPQEQKTEGLEYIHLYDEPSGLYCGQHHPAFDRLDADLSRDEIEQMDCVGLSYSLPERIAATYRRHELAARVGDTEGVAFLIMTGHFIGYLPVNYAERWREKGAMRRLLPQAFGFTRHFSAVTREVAHRDKVLNAYLEALSEVS